VLILVDVSKVIVGVAIARVDLNSLSIPLNSLVSSVGSLVDDGNVVVS